ncbi:hypothetical protein QF034_001128 [Streptomyces africanus]|uniref:DUF559 domain-containing protein n=1 Tax=Streptomyces africanus TaxID=231024 RepID=A0ABU0QHP7_9ACTN|nr:hypothetical protein [Streptomyces africanus]MDQ0746897.1 hypothetical protein [Streptomyces africanus]
MADELRSLDEILANPNLSDEERQRLRRDKVLGGSAFLLHEQGDVEVAGLAAEAELEELIPWSQSSDYELGFKAVLRVEPHLFAHYTEEALNKIAAAMRVTMSHGETIDEIEARPSTAQVSVDWRKQFKAANGPAPNNQARRIRMEPQHPIEDGLHFTNEWERRVYMVLKERQAALSDNDTIGILPLPRMKVLKSIPVEPDFLITYRGRVGIIEVDGHYHRGPRSRSDDHSRERLIRNAGVRQIDRIDVRDSTSKEEVEKFVIDFLKHLAS